MFSCGFSGLPCEANSGYADVRVMVIRRNMKASGYIIYPFDLFEPVTALMKGRLGDYGYLDVEDPTLFREWATSVGANFGPNISVKDLDPDHRLWFIREDVFEFIETLIWDDNVSVKKNVAMLDQELTPVIGDGAENMPSAAQRAAAVEAMTQQQRALLKGMAPSEMFIRSKIGLKVSPWASVFNRDGPIFKTYFGEGLCEKVLEGDRDKAVTHFRRVLDLVRVYCAMASSRKLLVPAASLGPSIWDPRNDMKIGKLIAGRATEKHKANKAEAAED